MKLNFEYQGNLIHDYFNVHSLVSLFFRNFFWRSDSGVFGVCSLSTHLKSCCESTLPNVEVIILLLGIFSYHENLKIEASDHQVNRILQAEN